MYLIGDIGNTEIKVCLVNYNKKIIKRINFSNNHLSLSILKKNFNKFEKYLPKIKKILFCSVVPNTFKKLKSYFAKKLKLDAMN